MIAGLYGSEVGVYDLRYKMNNFSSSPWVYNGEVT